MGVTYEVLMHNVPKVSEDGTKSLPIAPHQTHEFDDLDEAKKAAADNKDKFDRVVLMSSDDGKQRMVERYMDGEHIIPEPKEEPAPAESQEESASTEESSEESAN